MILKQLPGPFLGWMMLLMFLLLMQFLIRFLPDLTGRDLPIALILELIMYNLSYMVVLAVPMSSLLATLMVFGSLAESRTWVVIRNCGITLWSLTWPVFVAAALLSWGMTYFNNVLLPESNFRALNMWQTIRSARPGFELEPGVFYQEIDEYSILVGQRDHNFLYDILIYDYTNGLPNPVTIRATMGELVPKGNFLEMILLDGEMHRLMRPTGGNTNERYEKLIFDRFSLTLDLSELGLQDEPETQGYRSDRSTPVDQMIEIVDSLKLRVTHHNDKLRAIAPVPAQIDTSIMRLQTEDMPEYGSKQIMPRFGALFRGNVDSIARSNVLEGLTMEEIRRTFQHARDLGQSARSAVSGRGRNLKNTTTLLNRYQVEIHKKYSISLACFIFVLIGIPLGLSIRRGGLGIASLAAMSIFIFYWFSLVQGEKLADRGFLNPWIGMWIANILIGIVGIWLYIRVAHDRRSKPSYAARSDAPTHLQ